MNSQIRAPRVRRACATAFLVIFTLAWFWPAPALAQLPSPGSLVVTMTSPTSGSTVSSTIPVSASVTIVGSLVVAGVQFQLDGVNLGAEDTTAPYSIPWNTTTASNGSHTLRAVARDLLGLRFTSDPVTVTVFNDKTAPTVTITSPTSGATVTSTIPVSAIASDNVGVVGVQFKLDGVNLGAEDTAAPYSISWDTTITGNGSHTLTAVARDAAGNRTSSAPVTVTVSNGASPDTTPPTVAITAPSAGITVSGVITVTASASDASGVTLVQFLVDGVELGRDPTAPYEATWDTRTVADGTHTLQARAQDTAGNVGTSAAVTVTVANGAPPSPSAATRFEETDPSAVFGPGWARSTSPRWSGGTANISTTAGAQATFSFTGTSVSWIGFHGPMAGIARVLLDGALVGDVDMFAPTEEFRLVVFTRPDLAAGSHTLTIEVTGRKNSASTDTYVAVDAFDAPAPTVTRFQETDRSIAYTLTPGWTTIRGTWSEGTAAIAATAGAQATFTFTGTSVSWIGFSGPNAGIARVLLDGVLVDDVDLFGPTAETEVFVLTAADLADVSHTLTIEVTGFKNAASTDTAVAIDAFEVTSSSPQTRISRFEETNPSVEFTPEGGWFGNADSRWSAGMAALSTTTAARATVTFTGTSVTWIGFRGPVAGIARVLLDGVQVAVVDTFASAAEFQAVLFTQTGLAGTHTLTVEVTGERNPASTNTFIVVDAFDVTF